VQGGVPVRVIPGISAGIGGLGCAGIPATHRDVNQSVTFVTGHDQSGQAPAALNWQAISDGAQVLVIFMGMKHVRTITAELLAAGRPGDQPCAVVCAATLPEQRVVQTTLAAMADDIDAAGLEPPAILCIGRSVLLEQALDWRGMVTGMTPAGA
jgi:uroporphyrin-III C-methyltransferase